jgi:hypothetical protein
MTWIAEATLKLEEMSKYACPHVGCDYRLSPGLRNPSHCLTKHIDG